MHKDDLKALAESTGSAIADAIRESEARYRLELATLREEILILRHQAEMAGVKLSELERQCLANKKHVANVESKISKSANLA